ncbi:hypothetical protein [Geodermatophilus poikilotrophus]|uniref:VCBS repeat-containing protein n=1 Tax=Geodermatophilus poikilotrophus TaxID=1333667 RepID=A0A1I0IQF1_9ACTN|nr:hypothetical protein [Geodermatophilus poikilotrophus]SET99329.1 hypothetical protein SAMN04488546_4588 [Geodermatophilus poikilotrophus]
MKRRIGLGGVLALGLSALLATPAQAAADVGTVYVPDDFLKAASDTRATGHYEVDGTALHIWTEGSGRTDKVAEYIATDTSLDGLDEPFLEYEATSGGVPGFQLIVDFDDDGTSDGILIGEPGFYGNDWWLSNAAEQFVKDGAPLHTGGFGSADHGTLADWDTAFPSARVIAFGFSLGSGVEGDGVLDAINFAGVRYTFAEHTVLTGKDACKGGGWATSTKPEFRNQGQCVSYFAKLEKMK